jgi:hypothetical protein
MLTGRTGKQWNCNAKRRGRFDPDWLHHHLQVEDNVIRPWPVAAVTVALL